MTSSKGIHALLHRAGTKNPEAAVMYLAHRLHEQSGRKAPFFHAEEFCAMVGISVMRVPLRDCDARITAVPGGFIAEVCSTHPPQRQRFSLCHEVGHTFFASPRGNLYKQDCGGKGKAGNTEERLCNLAAAELLMPKDQFATAAHDCTPSWEAVDKLSTLFFTSTQATLMRCLELNAWAAMTLTLTPTSDRTNDGFCIARTQSAASAFAGRGCQFVALDFIKYALRTDEALQETIRLTLQERRRIDVVLELPSLRTAMFLKLQYSLHGGTPAVSAIAYAGAN